MARKPSADAVEALDLIIAGLMKLRASWADPEPSDAGRMVGAKEVARLLGMHHKSVRRRAEELGGIKAGGAWRFPLERVPRR